MQPDHLRTNRHLTPEENEDAKNTLLAEYAAGMEKMGFKTDKEAHDHQIATTRQELVNHLLEFYTIRQGGDHLHHHLTDDSEQGLAMRAEMKGEAYKRRVAEIEHLSLPALYSELEIEEREHSHHEIHYLKTHGIWDPHEPHQVRGRGMVGDRHSEL